ncbi:hypothetical protein BO71DRAFT_171638 [Aspergillus ellipticus CBS 707.79]|uniref:Uncharacterized protein n=1 Tax=Aspergillus ellipticus CBS 707.79 TaxID=1448320 RepID=A0A319DTS2_9EURO|nr:hypothetical protein BO71DRAFT_171638 [Aspergillus ellipticus CBS 707.79]
MEEGGYNRSHSCNGLNYSLRSTYYIVSTYVAREGSPRKIRSAYTKAHGYAVRSTDLSTDHRCSEESEACLTVDLPTLLPCLSPLLTLQISVEAPTQRSSWGDMWIGFPFSSLGGLVGHWWSVPFVFPFLNFRCQAMIQQPATTLRSRYCY